MEKKLSNEIKNIDSKNKWLEKLIFSGAGLFLALILLYFYLSIYYNYHFFNNTIINGVDVSNLKVKQVENVINTQVKSYILTLNERNNVNENIYGEKIDLHATFDGSLSKLLDEQNGFTWLNSLTKTKQLEINTMLEYNEDLLKDSFKELACLDKNNIMEPVDAKISEYSSNGYEIIPEDLGTKVKKDLLYEEIKKSIMLLEPSLDLDKAGLYVEPKIKSEDSKLLKALDDMNKLVSSKITYEFGDVTEIVDGKRISNWISVDKNYKVHLSADGVKEFVDYIGKTYNSFGRVRSFQTSYGDILKISGGDYGWWLNRGKELKDLIDLILNGQQVVREPAYFQTAQKYGADDIGETYVEINLTAQHLFFYKDGKLIVESDFVSGNVSKNYGTPTGTYPIQYRETDATLDGEDYSTPVKYWMPFNKNIGLHDASWRNSFGKDIYLKNGSHGCINLPPTVAKKIYENIKRGVAVVVYELKGTENYDIKEKEKKETDSNKLSR